MNNKNLTIGDLIHIPDVQKVIRLEQGKTDPEEIAGNFVFTREVAAHFTVITESLLKKTGQGYFLQGDFGSGKSHFLACLYTALEYGKTIGVLSRTHGGIKRIIEADIKLLPVDISLIKYRAGTSLEQIVIVSLENSLLERGIVTPLTPLSNFLNWLKSLLSDTTQAEIFTREFNLEDEASDKWIDDHPKDAYRCGMIFIKKQGLPSPELLVEDRHETFSRALEAVYSEGFDGIFLVIDELSEFFRSKPDTHSLNEDARTLQFLGELSQENPLWIIAAVQESIEKTGDIAHGTFRKIKDRFPVKLILSTLHIRSLISERLVKHKPGADEHLYSIYQEYRKQFSTFSLPYKEFTSIYPVHPATIALLDGLGDLFSVHRGIVDFVHSQIAGDEQRKIPGILKRPAMELLAPDSIFDHFETRISEFSQFYVYPRHILPHLKEVINKVIEEQKDRETALRLMKILMLYKIHPAVNEPDARELTELVACTLFFQNPDMNVRFIVEGILDPVVNMSRFLVKQPSVSNDPSDAVYIIVKEDDPGKLLKNRIESKEKEISNDDTRLILLPMSELEESTAWPGPEILDTGIQKSMEWFHSSRKVFISFMLQPGEELIDRVFYDFQESESDFGLILCPVEIKGIGEHFAVWQIPFHQMDKVLFSEFAATKLVAESLKPGNPDDAPLINLVNEKYTKMRPLIRNSLIDLIYSGRFQGREIETNPVIKQVKYFDKIIETAGEFLLAQRYPGFKRIAPRRISPSYRYYQRLLDEFVIPGSILIREARKKGLDDAINGLAVPLGLVELKAGSYVFSPDFTDYPLLSDFFSLLKASTHTPVHTVKQALGSGEYGLPDTIFYFLITALACAGLISLLKGGRTMPIDILSLITVQKADAIAPGELICKADRETLMMECQFLVPQAIWESFGLPAQREVWKGAIKFKETTQNDLSGISEMLNQYAEYSAFLSFNLKKIEKKVKDLSYVIDEIKISYAAKEGLQRFLRAWRGSGLSGNDVGFLKKFYRFLKYQAKSFVFIHHYINHPEIEKAINLNKDCEKLKSIVHALLKKPEISIVEDEGKHLGNVFEHFRDYYSRFYTKNHDEYYNSLKREQLSKYARRALDTIVALSGIESLDRPPGLSSLLRIVNNDSISVCHKRCAEELQSSPLCSCGYHLGDQSDRTSEPPEDIIEKVLSAYVDILNTPAVCECLTAWAYANQDRHPRMSRQLDSFCSILKDKKITPATLIDFLGQEMIELLEKALSGKVNIKQVDPADLLLKLTGRRLPADQIISIVSHWLGAGDENTIFSIEGGMDHMVSDSQLSVEWWPLLHRGIFQSSQDYTSSYMHMNKTLEKAYPGTRLREALKKCDTNKVLSFAFSERFHYQAIVHAWQIICERVLSGEQWSENVTIKSLLIDSGKGEEIEHSFKLIVDMSRCRKLSFPRQLKLRLLVENIITHPYCTDELKNTAFNVMEKWAHSCGGWADTLQPVSPIDLEDNPIIVICDGVSADVWLEATTGNSLFDKVDKLTWYTLSGASKTIDALIELFGFRHDPLDEFYKRDVQYYTLKGNEEHTLSDQILPLPKKAVVIRVNMIDRAGHEGRMDLKDMADCLKRIFNTKIPGLYEICTKEKRRLIITVDHGFSLGKSGLSHGSGGIFECIIPFVEWGVK